MRPRARSAALWGLVGALAFLVLLLGYRLFVGTLEVGPWLAIGVAVLVGGVVTAAAYATERRLTSKGRT